MDHWKTWCEALESENFMLRNRLTELDARLLRLERGKDEADVGGGVSSVDDPQLPIASDEVAGGGD